MFNWSLGLREQTGYLSPVGPNFNGAPTQHLYINGSHISLVLPRQKTKLPVKSITLCDELNTATLDDKLQESNGIRYRFITTLMREWDFNGPWFTGKLGGMEMTATLMSPAIVPAGLNYFHPRALELGVAEYLTSRYGGSYSGDHSRQAWHAPTNWRQLHQFPCVIARFDAANTAVKIRGPNYHLAIPLAKTHYWMFELSVNRSGVFTDKVPKPTIDEWIDLTPFTTLANQVLDSIKVELSPQALAEQEEALGGLSEEEKQLVKEYPPLKWSPPAREVDENWREKYSNN